MIEPKVGDRVAFWSSRRPGHLSHGKAVQFWNGCVWVEALRPGRCGVKKITIMSLSDLVYDNMSDTEAPADFAAVGEQVRQEREAGNGKQGV